MPLDNPSEKDMAGAQALLSIFDQQDDDGEYVFTDDEVRHMLPLLVIGAGLQPADCPEAVQEMLGEFVADAGISLDDPADVVAERIRAFYDEIPVNPELWSALGAFLRENAAGAAELASRAAQRLVGAEQSLTPVGAGGRKEGTARGGVMARLEAGKVLDDAASAKKKKK